MLKNILIVANLAAVLVLGIYVILVASNERSGYVVSQEVFNGFEGKKELESKLKTFRIEAQLQLDSLKTLIQTNPQNEKLLASYESSLNSLQIKEQEISDRFTRDIWTRINEYVSEYGKENDYTFIYGATGDGNLMYAADSKNITNEVLKFVNTRYAKGVN